MSHFWPEGDTGQPENWVGRQEELERLDVWWRSGRPVAWVEGQAGLGKSGLIRTWIAAFNELGYEAEETCVTGYISGRDLERGSTELEEWVRRHPEQRLLLMIDGFDEARHPDLALVFTQRAIDARVRVLISSRSAVPSRLASIGTTLTLADLGASSGEELLRNAGLVEQVSEKLLQRYGGSPLMLALIARALSDGRATVEDLLNIDQRGSGLGQLLTRTVGRYLPMPGASSKLSLSTNRFIGQMIPLTLLIPPWRRRLLKNLREPAWYPLVPKPRYDHSSFTRLYETGY